MKRRSTIALTLLVLFGCSSSKVHNRLPQSVLELPVGFVSLRDVDPSIVQEIRNSGSHNLIGKPVNGYYTENCILTQAAARALKEVQSELKPFALSLKVYDCYRPQKAVTSFVAWAKDLDDEKMKKEFYPRVDKKDLFKDGYIADKSSHSRGSTVDVTLVPFPIPKQRKFREKDPLFACYLPANLRFKDNMLDFGTGYNCFDPLSHTNNSEVGPIAQRNRLLLKSVMEKNGFKNLPQEWWHYTLENEAFPSTYFDFIVQ